MKVRSFEELYREAEKHDDYWEFGVVLRVLEELVARMESQQISRAELARRLGTSPAYVTKILRGNANFTLTSLVKLARAVGAELVVSFADPASAAKARVKRARQAAGDASVCATTPTARAAGGSAPRSRRS